MHCINVRGTGSIPADYLIVGQGLAGSLLAWELMRRHCRVVVVDNGFNNASQVAAGLINPVTGIRLVKSQDASWLLSAAKHYYAELGRHFQEVFFLEKPMLRLFCTRRELEFGRRRLVDPVYRGLLGNILMASEVDDCLAVPLGGLEQKQTGYLRTVALLNALKISYIQANAFLQDYLDYADIVLAPEVQWRNIRPRRIIFCEGYRARQNPWFSYLPLQPVKGEILTLEHCLNVPDKIINYGQWLLPINQHTIKIGATFDHKNIDEQTTEAGKNELLCGATRFLPNLGKARLIEHQAGIRPATSDRQPLLGLHPNIPVLGIFNGFGAKGSLYIPAYCQLFADYLLHGKALPSHCSIDRFGLSDESA